MKLIRISAVNWYLYNPIDINVIGNTAIIGVNGTGKSTILDAIQVVLFGANMNHIRFNAKATTSVKNLRNLKSYCLGAHLPTEDAKEAISVRKDAETYLALSFEGNGKIVNLFVAMEARYDEPKVDVRLLAVGRGSRALSCEDFITRDANGGYTPISISHIQEALSLKGFTFKACHNSKEYAQDMTIELGPDRMTGESITPEVLSRTLSKSLSIGEIDGVSNFVKRFILEDKPLNVDSVINARNQYQQILKQIEEDNKKIEELRPIDKRLKRSLKLKKDSVALHWLYFEEHIAELDYQLGTLYERRETIVENYLQNRKQAGILNAEAIELNSEILELRDIIAKDDNVQEQKRLLDEISQLDTQKKDIQAKLDSLIFYLKEFSEPEFRALLDPNFDISPIERIARAINVNGEINYKKLDADLIHLPELVVTIEQTAKERWRKMDNLEQECANEIERLTNLISTAKAGQITLKEKTQLVMAALSSQGIESVPLCQVAEVTEPRWQRAVEAFLGDKVEALIVDPKDEVAAYRVYRQMRADYGSNIYNVTIVRTGKSSEWLNRYQKGSAGEIVKSENEYALAYLHNQLGGFILVDSEKELVKHPRAMTDDGMVTTPSSTSRNRLPNTLKLVADPSVNIPIWEKESEELGLKRGRAEEAANSLDTIRNSSVVTQERLKGFVPLSSLDLKQRIDEHGKNINAKQSQADQIDLTNIEQKQQRLDLIEKQHESKGNELTKLSRKRGGLSKESKQVKTDYRELHDKTIPELSSARRVITESPDYDPNHVNELNDTLSFEKPEDIQTMAKKADHDSTSQFENGIMQLRNYLNSIDFFIEQGEALTYENIDRVVLLVTNQLKYIETDSLAHHISSAQRAEREMNESYRSDMINKLKAAFDELTAQFKTINKSLSKSKFHGSTYAFRAYEKKEFADLINYIRSVSEADANDVGDMFDNTPESVKEDIDRLISGEGEGLKAIEDYREYFDYDVEITNVETGAKIKLSALGSFGSGGENQAPFYVALASALSSAWKTLKRPGESLGLALLDEAFNNLSEDNLVNAKDYMNKVGLQLIVAAPSDREPTFRTMVDTFVYISREQEAVEITVDYITEKGRTMLARHNPNLNPDMVKEQLAVNA